MGEEKKFNFVYEDTREEDNEYIKSLEIMRVYHGGIIEKEDMWTVDRDSDMYLVYNDAPNALIHEGVTGGKYMNFIYKNKVSWVEYVDNSDWKNKVKYIKFVKVEICKSLESETYHVLEAIKESFKIKFENNGNNYKCVFVNDIEEIHYI